MHNFNRSVFVQCWNVKHLIIPEYNELMDSFTNVDAEGDANMEHNLIYICVVLYYMNSAAWDLHDCAWTCLLHYHHPADVMMTSSNENIFRRVTWPLCREFTSYPWIPLTTASDANKRLSKQSWSWWFETSSYALWRPWNTSPLCHWL